MLSLKSIFKKRRQVGAIITEREGFGVLEENKFSTYVFRKGEIVPEFFNVSDLATEIGKRTQSHPYVFFLSPVFLKTYTLEHRLDPIPKSGALTKNEAEKLKARLIKEVHKTVFEKIWYKAGFTLSEIVFLQTRFLWFYADGYEMLSLEGMWGEDLKVGIFVVSCHKNSCRVAQEMRKSIEKVVGQKIVMEPLSSLLVNLSFVEKDIVWVGQDYSYFLRKEQGRVLEIREREWGVNSVYLAFSQELGWRKEEARHYLSEFKKGRLSESTSLGLEKILKRSFEEGREVLENRNTEIIVAGDKLPLECMGLEPVSITSIYSYLSPWLWEVLEKGNK